MKDEIRLALRRLARQPAFTNPAILTLPTATMSSPEEEHRRARPRYGEGEPSGQPVNWRTKEGRPPPNLGPPPEPPDWRKRR